MLISRKLRKLDKVMSSFPETPQVWIVARDVPQSALTRLGFSFPFQTGENLLPSADFGTSCRRNAEGYDIIRRDLPKETRTRQISWRWKEFHGQDVVEKEGIVDRPYQRYPREHIPAYSQELTTYISSTDIEFVASGPFEIQAAGAQAALLNTIRMFVEIFGTCEVASSFDLSRSFPHRRQLNWVVLPPGRRRFEDSTTEIGKAIERLSASSQIVVLDRINSLMKYGPDFTAYGQHGFNKYVVYGWDKANLYLLESTEVDNATYILKHNWEQLSRLSKAEVLASNGSHGRLIHHKGWTGELGELMAKHDIAPQ